MGEAKGDTGRERDADAPDADAPDATDVIEGPIGDAALRDPASDPDMGADLEALPGVDDVTPKDPASVRGSGDERADGRPTGDDGDRLKAGQSHGSAPTVAPEEEGHEPATEHAPGSDL